MRPEDLDPDLERVSAQVRRALSEADLPDVDPALERPRQVEHGDWATTVALRLAGQVGRPPRAVAETIVEHLEVPDVVDDVEIAGPGFVNFRLAHRYFTDRVVRIVEEGADYGRRVGQAGQRVNVEFVSANPTGPLHVGAGRWAALGDSISALLETAGHDVTREYYFNDAGGQMRRFGESVLRVATGQPLTDDHYQGTYVAEIADAIRADLGDGAFEGPRDEVVPRLADEAGTRMIASIRALLHRMGVDFDVWFSEQSLHERGEIDEVLAALDEAGDTYEQDGAVWLATTRWGDEKDRVLVRSDGRPTYLAADCAYLHDKLARGFERLVYLVGADHHGWASTMQHVVHAFDVDPEAVELLVGQFVNLTRSGDPVRMSKRAGTFVTLDELIDEVGVDVARYHFLRQGMDTTIDFDLDAVVARSMDNPVYYVQYAHARISSLIQVADDTGFDPGSASAAELELLTEPAEIGLLRRLCELPEVLAEAAELRAPHRVAHHAEDLAADFHRFYTDCRVLVDDESLARARYWLAVAARQVLRNALAVLRVSAPERM